MTGQRYTKLPFYGSTDPEEFLDWQEQMEIELEVQEFSETKKISRAILEFEDYALDWWKQYPHKRLIKNWEDLKKAMRKEFVSRKYGLILLRRLENVKQGTKSVQVYYDKLYSSMHRANIVDGIDTMSYFKRGLNPNIAAAVEGKYFRGMQDLLSCAIREEKKIMKVQQDKITRCINLCQDICSKLQPNVSSVAKEKQASTACKKKGHVVPKVSSVDSSAKRSEHQQCNSKKNSIEQQEDNIVPQVDKRNDEVCNITVDHNVTPTPERVAIPKCQLQSKIVKKEVTYNPIIDCLNSKQEKEDKSPTHTKKVS